MLRAHTVGQVRRAEADLAATLPAGELMNRAATGLAHAVRPRLTESSGAAVLVLVGTGDNGGDALYAGAILARGGAQVALLLTDADNVHGEGLRTALAAGARRVDAPGGQPVVLDGVVGIGGHPGLREPALSWRTAVDDAHSFVIAVDVPSGIDVDGGTLTEPYLQADATYTFGTYKVGVLAGPAADACGQDVPELIDIGLEPHLGPPAIEAIEAGDGHLVAEACSWWGRPQSHKYTRGVVGVAAGSEKYAGAAQLCVRGAQAGVAGMVRFVGPGSLASRIVDRCPEVVHGRGRVQAWVVGSGGGEDTEQLVALALADRVPVVLDAEALAFLPERLEIPALLTPHAGELAELMGVDRGEVEADPLGYATRAAERWGATVLLKGRRTLVAHPGEPARVNLSGAPWLGTAGAGDVLAGLAGSFLAAGADPRLAGSLAAYLHGAAGVRANPGGPVTAGQVADAIPATIAAMRRGELSGSEVRDWADT